MQNAPCQRRLLSDHVLVSGHASGKKILVGRNVIQLILMTGPNWHVGNWILTPQVTRHHSCFLLALQFGCENEFAQSSIDMPTLLQSFRF